MIYFIKKYFDIVADAKNDEEITKIFKLNEYKNFCDIAKLALYKEILQKKL